MDPVLISGTREPGPGMTAGAPNSQPGRHVHGLSAKHVGKNRFRTDA